MPRTESHDTTDAQHGDYDSVATVYTAHHDDGKCRVFDPDTAQALSEVGLKVTAETRAVRGVDG
jgi:hypothetical protein